MCSIRLVSFRVRTGQQKLTSLSGCVLVYDSAREPVKQSIRGSACDQSASGSEFEVGGATSSEDFPRRVSRRSPLATVAES